MTGGNGTPRFVLQIHTYSNEPEPTSEKPFRCHICANCRQRQRRATGALEVFLLMPIRRLVVGQGSGEGGHGLGFSVGDEHEAGAIGGGRGLVHSKEAAAHQLNDLTLLRRRGTGSKGRREMEGSNAGRQESKDALRKGQVRSRRRGHGLKGAGRVLTLRRIAFSP